MLDNETPLRSFYGHFLLLEANRLFCKENKGLRELIGIDILVDDRNDKHNPFRWRGQEIAFENHDEFTASRTSHTHKKRHVANLNVQFPQPEAHTSTITAFVLPTMGSFPLPEPVPVISRHMPHPSESW